MGSGARALPREKQEIKEKLVWKARSKRIPSNKESRRGDGERNAENWSPVPFFWLADLITGNFHCGRTIDSLFLRQGLRDSSAHRQFKYKK